MVDVAAVSSILIHSKLMASHAGRLWPGELSSILAPSRSTRSLGLSLLPVRGPALGARRPMIIRKLSFSRKGKERPSTTAPKEAPPEKSVPHEQQPSALAAPPPPAKKEARGSLIRRNLSFKRQAKKEPTAEAAAAGPPPPGELDVRGAAAAAPASPRSLISAAAASPSVGMAQIRRTFSWNRGIKLSKQNKEEQDRAFALRGVGLERAARVLLLHLPPAERAALCQANRALRAAAADVMSRPAALPPHPLYAAHTHEGGAGGCGKENQDTYFVVEPSPELSVYGVLDGHGRRYGRLASQVAAARMRSLFTGLHKWVVDAPEEAVRVAFREAHLAIHEAITRADPQVRRVPGHVGSGPRGDYLLHWLPPDDEADEADGAEAGRWDAVDGGTTATVVILVRGERAVVGMAGDSSILLIGRDAQSGAASHRVLIEEHSPTNLAEYVRVRALPHGQEVRFVYDCPDFEEFPIFNQYAHRHRRHRHRTQATPPPPIPL